MSVLASDPVQLGVMITVLEAFVFATILFGFFGIIFKKIW